MAARSPLRILGLSLLTMTALLSGCTTPVPGTPPAPSDDAAAATPAPPLPTVDEKAFGWEAGVGAPGTGVGTQAGASNAVSPDVPADTARMLVNITWTCATPACDLQVWAWEPGAGPGNLDPAALLNPTGRAEGPSPLSIVIEEPVPGTWQVGAFDSGASAGVAGSFVVTLVPRTPGAEAAEEEHEHVRG